MSNLEVVAVLDAHAIEYGHDGILYDLEARAALWPYRTHWCFALYGGTEVVSLYTLADLTAAIGAFAEALDVERPGCFGGRR